MALDLKADLSGYEQAEIRNAVSYALTSSANQARQRFAYYTGSSGFCCSYNNRP